MGLKRVVFSPDGKHLATASQDQTVKLWDVESGKLLRTLDGHEQFVDAATFFTAAGASPLLATGGSFAGGALRPPTRAPSWPDVNSSPRQRTPPDANAHLRMVFSFVKDRVKMR